MCARRAWAAERERGPASVRHHMANIWPTYGQHMANIWHGQPRLTEELSRGTTHRARAPRARRPPPPAAGRRQATKLLPVTLCERFQAYEPARGFERDRPQRAPPKPKVRARPRRTVR